MTGTNVHNLIRRAHHGGFMFDHNHRVPGVAQLFENVNESVRVARMQADTGFVEDEERIHQPGAKAGGQIDALGFAARKSARRTVESKIAQADFGEVGEAGADFGAGVGEGVSGG